VSSLFALFAMSLYYIYQLVHNLQYQVPELVGDLAQQMLMVVQRQVRRPTDHGIDVKGQDNDNKDNDDDMPHDDDDDYYYYQAVLDAGCGTGLAGRQLRPLIYNTSTSAVGNNGDGGGSSSSHDNSVNPGGIMIGVDASRKMLDKAAQLCTLGSSSSSTGCGVLLQDSNNHINKDQQQQQDNNRPLYDNLLQMDLLDMTINNTIGTIVPKEESRHDNSDNNDDMNSNAGFDLVVAADVLVYFGNLDRIIGTFASVSRRGAILIFSTELLQPDDTNNNSNKHDDSGWRVLPLSGRFAHTKQHAMDVATRHGYQLVSYREIVPRMEKGEPVQGQLFAFVLVEPNRPIDHDDEGVLGAAAADHDDTSDQHWHGNEL
jgi:predicted TPR repeat methyltransferase